MKKELVLFSLILLLIPLVLAQTYKIEISTSKDTFEAGEKIIFKITLLDESNKPINDKVSVVFADAEKKTIFVETVDSNEFVEAKLSDRASYGRGTITATYKDIESVGFFDIGINELAQFTLDGDNLIIKNTGNTKYAKTVQITIGETTGNQYPKLNIGESISYRLVAPDGTYNIKVTDGKTTLTQGEVTLTGTGQVIGAIDQTSSDRAPLTGVGGRPEQLDDENILTYVKGGSFGFVFVLVIFGAMILLAIERRYHKKVKS